MICKQRQNYRTYPALLDLLCSGSFKIPELNGFLKSACRQGLILGAAALPEKLRKFLGSSIRCIYQFGLAGIEKPPYKQSIFHSFSLNYLLLGMAFSTTVANTVSEDVLTETMRAYSPLLSLSFVIVIVNLGMPMDYRLIAGAGLFTAVYTLSRAARKIGGAYLGGKMTKAEPPITKYLGFTLLPHSGVSLVFTGIAVTTLTEIDASLASIVSGTIVAAAIINEIIAVIVAKFAFKWAGEIK